jgi:hypothetical protein
MSHLPLWYLFLTRHWGWKCPGQVYVMTSYPGVHNSRDVFLNGEVMRLADPVRGVLPAIKGRPVAAGEAVHFPPVSYGFVVFPEAGVALCK